LDHINHSLSYRFESSIHDPDFLFGELGLPAQILEGYGNGLRHSCVFQLIDHLFDGTFRRWGHGCSWLIVDWLPCLINFGADYDWRPNINLHLRCSVFRNPRANSLCLKFAESIQFLCPFYGFSTFSAAAALNPFQRIPFFFLWFSVSVSFTPFC